MNKNSKMDKHDYTTILLLFGVTLLLNVIVALAQEDPIELAMEKVDQAYEMSCAWDKKLSRWCQYKLTDVREKINSKFYFEKNPHRREPYFQTKSKEYLKKLPIPYHEKCAKYLDNLNEPPPADESQILEDEGQNYPFKAFAHCLLSVLRIESKGVMASDPDEVDYCWEKLRKAFNAACGAAGSNVYQCQNQQERVEQNIRTDPLIQGDDAQMGYLANWGHHALDTLPPTYKETCGKYLDKSMAYAPAPVDKSVALDDDRERFPYRAYAHCLRGVARKLNDAARQKRIKEGEQIKAKGTFCFKTWDNGVQKTQCRTGK